MNTTTRYPTLPTKEKELDDRVGMSTSTTSGAHDAEVISEVDAADDAEFVAPTENAEPPTESWQRIQAKFVDDPRKAVAEAHQLVGEVVQHIVEGFTRERSDLERQWSKGDSVSTEDLRMCLQRYRAFFTRLSPTADSHTS